MSEKAFQKKKGTGTSKKKKTTVTQAVPKKAAAKKKSKKSDSAKESSGAKDDKGYELEEWDNREESDDENSVESDEDYSDDGGDEGEEGYRPGGYHPVNVGERYNARYTVLKKLGWGHFSTVWLVHDKKHSTKGTAVSTIDDSPEFVALKIQKSAPHYREAALDEIELLRCAAEAAKSAEVLEEFGPKYDSHVVHLLDHFEHTGPNGDHFCFIFETLGENLLEVIKKYDYKGIPIPIVKRLVQQTCIALDFLHRHCKIIHTDLKPENILIATPPPLPDAEEVRNLLAYHNPTTGVGSGKGKKKKKGTGIGGGGTNNGGTASDNNGPSSISDITRTIEDLTRQLQDTTLSAEARKKLKNKIKKKKSQLKGKKKGGKKKKRPSRRNGEGREDKQREREDDERRAMEADSEKIKLQGEIAELDAKMSDVMGNFADAVDDQLDREAGPKSPSSSGSSKRGDIDYKSDEKGQAKDSSSYQSGEEKRSFSHSSPSSADSGFPDPPVAVTPEKELLSGEQLMLVMPPWLRPTLFSMLNFSGVTDEDEEDEDDIRSSSSSSSSRRPAFSSVKGLSPDAYCRPREESYARLTMVVSAAKLLDVFGAPCEIGDDDEGTDIAFANWYLRLSQADGGEDKDDASLHFCLRGHGDDSMNLTGLVAKNILNSIAYQPEKYSLRMPIGEDRPVVWNILHDAKRTEHICAFLEHALDGVKFLAHYQVPRAISEEDDIDLLEVMRRQVIHPLCEEMDDDLPHGASYGEGGGSLVGIDVDSLSRSVTHVDDDPSLPESERRVYSITKFVHPLRQRVGYFSGDPEIMDDTVLLFNRVHSTLLALGEGSDGGSDDENDGGGGSGGGGDKSNLHLADLNAEYSRCKVKVVDLGNACWTFKHFTDDIQTRQYRSPEVLLGAEYDTSADMWSLGCIVFELLTGDLLFDPRSGSKWDREEDHLAMMIELVGNFPASVYRNGKRASQYFSSVGELRNIAELKFWPLEDVLMDKYRFSEEDAKGVAAFLMPVLAADPAVRATAKECVTHPWLVDA